MIRHGRNVAIYINGIDLSGDLNAINPVSEQELADVSTFGTQGHQLFPGLAKDTGTIEAIYNSTEATLFESLIQVSSSYPMMVCFGQTVGDPAYGLEEVMLKSNGIKSIATDVNKASINFDTDNHPFEDCRILAPKTSVVATGTGTGYDNTTSTLIGGAGYTQIFGVSTGALILSIQDSATGAFAGEQTTTCTFASVSTAGVPTAQRVAISGTISRYTRAAWVITGSTCSFAVALKRY